MFHVLKMAQYVRPNYHNSILLTQLACTWNEIIQEEPNVTILHMCFCEYDRGAIDEARSL